MTFPDRFKERYCPIVDDPGMFLSSLSSQLPRSFRINTLKSSAGEVKERFTDYGIAIRQMPWYADAFVSEEPDIGATLEHFTGAIYMQELASMLPPLLVREELREARLVLDGCAAPGSKTTQLSALMENKRTIIANDIDYQRIKALKFNLEKTGALNVIITNQDLRMYPQMQFDLIILDVPCSAEGTMRKSGFLSDWSEKTIKGSSTIQKKLILKGFDLLCPGGTMVYSTCTFAPEENEAVLDHLLKNRPAQLEPISIDGFKLSKPLEEWMGETFHPEVQKTARVWPHHNDTGGFYLAKVKK